MKKTTLTGENILKINLTIDYDEPTYELLERITVQTLKNSRECLLNNISRHPDDIRMVKKLLKSFNMAIEYYGD